MMYEIVKKGDKTIIRRARTKHNRLSQQVVNWIIVIGIWAGVFVCAAMQILRMVNHYDRQQAPNTSVVEMEEQQPIPAQTAVIYRTALIKEADKSEGISLNVPTSPESNTGFKAWMDFRTITSRSSKQWELQQDAVTDPQTGIRMYDGRYMVALGTYYAQSAGERFHIVLDSGIEFDAITGDIKSDKHTDELHQHRNGSIVEFIVDKKALPKMAKRMGDVSYAGFEGRVAEIIRES